MVTSGFVQKSEDDLHAILSPKQFKILQQKAQSIQGREYGKFFGEGIYSCAGCGTSLYKSTTKFWPAFYEGLLGAIYRNQNPDGMRIEITHVACDGHLGHMFKGEGFPETNK